MKIAILGTRGIPARYGGFETFAENLAIGLTRSGHDVTVFCEARDVSIPEYRQIRLKYVRVPRLGPLSTIVFDAFCLARARKEFDVVYMLGYGAALLCWLPRFWGTSVWINMDGIEWKRGKWGWAAKCYLRAMEFLAMHIPNRIIADARTIRDNLRERHRGSRTPCDVIPYGCNVVQFAPAPELISHLNLISGDYYLVVCRFEPENHVKEIIQGHLASSSRSSLVLVGDHEANTCYVRGLREFRDSRLFFTGPIYDPDILRSLRWYSKAYVHGHSVGGTNPSLLEAMGCSNLILAHDNVFNREVLSSTGLFFNDAPDLTNLINQVENGVYERESFGAAAKNRAEQFYTWARVVDAYDRLLLSPKLSTAEQDYGPPSEALIGRPAVPSF